MSALSGCSSRRASNCSTGPRAASGETVRSAPARRPVGDQARRSSTAATSGSHSASSESTWAGSADGATAVPARPGRDRTARVRRAGDAGARRDPRAALVGGGRRRPAGSGSRSAASNSATAAGGRIRQRRQRLGDLTLPGGEPVERARHRAGHGGVGGQVGEIVRDGLGEVGSQAEQGDHAVGLPLPERLGERAEAGPTSGVRSRVTTPSCPAEVRRRHRLRRSR